jgi:diguanylate cyclase (GGDEF)-like protein/PAS domain S-box-containing protein
VSDNPTTAGRRKQGVIAYGLAGFAAVFVARLVFDNPLDAVGMLYVIPVALFAAHFGARVGLLSGVLAFMLTILWTVAADVSFGPVGYVTRAAGPLFVGIAVGRLVEQRERVERASTRWFEMSNSMLCEASAAGAFTRVNGAWTEILGYAREELLAQPFISFVHPDDRERTAKATAALADGPADLVAFENRYRAKDGSWHWLSWSARSDGERIYGVAKDVTERKQLETEKEQLLARVAAMARTDQLTGLPNRRAWDEELRRELERARRSGHQVSVVMLDLDGLKEMNDRGGHQAGDELLQNASIAWRTALRLSDFIARFGGDEFAVVLPEASSEEGILALIERLREAMPDGQTCSAGVATWDGSESAEHLIARADGALYQAKRAGRDRVCAAA